MGKLLERLQASVTGGEITDVIEEWLCKHGEIGIYGALEQEKRIFLVAVRNGSQVNLSKYTHLEIQNVIAVTRAVAEVCGAQKAPHVLIPKKPEAPPPPTIEETLSSFQDSFDGTLTPMPDSGDTA